MLSCGGAAEDTIATTKAHVKGIGIQVGGGPLPVDRYGCLDVLAGAVDQMPLLGETMGD